MKLSKKLNHLIRKYDLFIKIVFQESVTSQCPPRSRSWGSQLLESPGRHGAQYIRTGPERAQSVSDSWRFCRLWCLVFFRLSCLAELSFLWELIELKAAPFFPRVDFVFQAVRIVCYLVVYGLSMISGSIFGSISDDVLCFLQHWFEESFCFDCASIVGCILVSF